jgi:ribosomal protein L24
MMQSSSSSGSFLERIRRRLSIRTNQNDERNILNPSPVSVLDAFFPEPRDDGKRNDALVVHVPRSNDDDDDDDDMQDTGLPERIPPSITTTTPKEGFPTATLQMKQTREVPNAIIGERVKIVKGTNKGTTGTIVSLKGEKTYVIRLEDGVEKNVRRTSVQQMEVEDRPSSEMIQESLTLEEHKAHSATPKNVPTSLTVQGVPGQGVKIVKGTNKGKMGTIVSLKGDKTYVIKLDQGEHKNVRRTSVELLPVNVSLLQEPDAAMEPPQKTSSHEIYSSPTQDTFAQVKIIAGQHAGEMGRVRSQKSKTMFVIEIDRVGTVNKREASLSFVTSKPTVDMCGAEWKVADSQEGGTRRGARFIVKSRLSSKQDKEVTFLSHILGNRVRIEEIPINKDECSEPYDKDLTVEGNHKYQLISAKIQADGDVNAGPWSKPKCMRLFYVQVHAPLLEPIAVQDLLLRVANFQALEPRKVMARLELLQSPTFRLPNGSCGLRFLKASDFCMTEDKGYVGCGFIAHCMMDRLMEGIYGSSLQASRVIAIQARFFIPSLGILKGMLVRKRILEGPPIQLNASMLKVPPSTHPEALMDRAALLICKLGVYTRSGMPNDYIGKLLNQQQKPPKSFKPKKLSDMVLRLWQGLGVPADICQEYAKESLRPCNICHAWVVGVADPTGSLPPGHVYVTGMTGHRNDIFITRSPCIKPNDGRVVPVLNEKPEAMSLEDWEFLKQMSFGAVIFANPKPGMLSMPEQIAGGDLDGDLYLVCWNEQILSHIVAEPLRDLPSEQEDPSQKFNFTNMDDEWFTKAQDLMIDASAVDAMSRLTGKLYTLSTKFADKSSSFMHDPDAIAFANAYNQALEFGKHGGKVTLPAHLRDHLPPNLRDYVTTTTK